MLKVTAAPVTTTSYTDTGLAPGTTYWYRFTSAALAEGPGGGSAPTAGEIADAVWDVAGTTAGWA